MKKVLVIAAHPDDEVLGCGGTIAKLAERGDDVSILILGEGLTSRYETRTDVEPELIKSLHMQARKASDILGVEKTIFENLPDNRFDTVPLLDIIKILEKRIAESTPDIIYTHNGADLNVDHTIVNRAVLTATRPTGDQPVREIYAFEVASSTEWSFQSLGPVFHPNTFIDISDFLDTKISALACYESEARNFPHPRSPVAIKANAFRWGSVVNCESAEAFALIRAIK